MAITGSGQVTLSDLAAEFGGNVPHEMAEYYKAVSGPVSSITVTGGSIPTSGNLAMSYFHGSAYGGGTQGGTHSATQDNMLGGSPTKTVTYTMSNAFNPNKYGDDIQFTFGGTLRGGPWTGDPSLNSSQSKGIGLQARVRFLYNGSVKATWGYTSIHNSTFNYNQTTGQTKSLSGNGTVTCTHPVNQVELSYYPNPSPGQEQIGGATQYCYHHATVTVNPTMS